MAALFPKWSNTVFWIVTVLTLALLLGGTAFLMAWVRTPQITGQYDPLPQPIDFDHRHHVADDGIDCRYCHDLVDRSPFAGVPPTERCMNCHNQIWNTSPLLEPVWSSYFTNTPIAWVRVHILPDFVYFSHQIHVNKGIGCESCHGRVDRMARVYQAEKLQMGWCLDCHRNPQNHLRPLDAITAMGWVPPRPQEEIGRELMEKYRVRRLVSCTTCHR
jgi:hypothetical protein